MPHSPQADSCELAGWYLSALQVSGEIRVIRHDHIAALIPHMKRLVEYENLIQSADQPADSAKELPGPLGIFLQFRTESVFVLLELLPEVSLRVFGIGQLEYFAVSDDHMSCGVPCEKVDLPSWSLDACRSLDDTVLGKPCTLAGHFPRHKVMLPE